MYMDKFMMSKVLWIVPMQQKLSLGTDYIALSYNSSRCASFPPGAEGMLQAFRSRHFAELPLSVPARKRTTLRTHFR